MKIAILTSGILPVPAVQGGAVENLIDFYLEYNDRHHLHDITVYSVWHPNIKNHLLLYSPVNHYVFIRIDSILGKLKKWIYKKKHGKNEYYHYSIEFYLNQAIKDIRKKKYNIIILENRPGYALKLKKISESKIVYHLHNEKLDTKTKYSKEIYNAATCIITVSDYIKSRVQSLNNKDNKTITVHNGINLTNFQNNNHSERNSHGLTKSDFVLVYSGRINEEKGIKELIIAIKKLKSYQEIKLLVIGSSFYGNTNNDNTFIKELKKIAAPLKDRIIFTGFIPYSEMPNYLSLADVAVIPSVWDDPFPTTVLEAQAMGLPIITTRRGGIPEEVTDENAYLLNTDEFFVENLTNAIIDLYKHPEKRARMATISLERSKLFDKETYAKCFFEVISTIKL